MLVSAAAVVVISAVSVLVSLVQTRKYMEQLHDMMKTSCKVNVMRNGQGVFICICYSMGKSFTSCRMVAVKSHEAKPSALSPLYRKRVEYIPEFHDCPCYNILIPWLLLYPTLLFPLYSRLHNGGAISLFFTLVGDISRRQVIFHVGR